jgi:hypothetical protein
MNAFYNIIQECANIRPKKYPSKNYEDFHVFSNSSEENNHMQINLLMYKLNQKFNENERCNMKYLKNIANTKLTCLKQNILKNRNLTEISDIFIKAQKCYFGFSLFCKIYKQRKYPVVVKDDLMLNPLDTKNKHTFSLIQNKSLYLFSIRDLANIIETALSQNDSFFLSPVRPKNPYNNIHLSNADMYNIYFKMKETSLKMPTLFHEYFLCEFNINLFSFENEVLLRQIAIKNFVFNTPYKMLVSPVFRMLDSNTYTRFLSIHKDFPKEKLVSIFREHLYYYYMIHYSLETINKINSYKTKLDKELKDFYMFNPFFGKRMIKYENFSTKTEFIFDEDHINFYGKTTKNIFEGRKFIKRDQETDEIIGLYIIKYDEANNEEREEQENHHEEEEQYEEDENEDFSDDDTRTTVVNEYLQDDEQEHSEQENTEQDDNDEQEDNEEENEQEYNEQEDNEQQDTELFILHRII